MWKYLLGLVAVFVGFLVVASATRSPAQLAAFDRLERIQQACDEAMQDAQLGTERRLTRLECELRIREAKQAWRDAK